jgi:hypothetical protein
VITTVMLFQLGKSLIKLMLRERIDRLAAS